MNELILFASTFALVFALGLQSLNVNGGHYIAAFFTSFIIGGANMVLLKLGPNAGASEIAAFLLGGPFGIVSSMYIHRRTIGKPRRNDNIPPRRNPAPKAIESEPHIPQPQPSRRDVCPPTEKP